MPGLSRNAGAAVATDARRWHFTSILERLVGGIARSAGSWQKALAAARMCTGISVPVSQPEFLMTTKTQLTPVDGKNVLITGGTGSLGKVLLGLILSGDYGDAKRVVVFSRDEAKQHALRTQYSRRETATDEVIYRDFSKRLQFRIGDVRDPSSLARALEGIDIVVNAAALKQVPTCEYSPEEAVRTNVGGAENIVRLIHDLKLPVETVVGVSTDKAVKPVNVMGMTKAIQERVFIRANLDSKNTRFVVVRYGNVLASRGSVIPFFLEQIANGGPVTITDPRMTRFLMGLDHAVATVMQAIGAARRGEIVIPRAPAARIVDVAEALIGGRPVATKVTGIRPGEKLHEVLISEEESYRVRAEPDFLHVGSMLPELTGENRPAADWVPGKEYASGDDLLSKKAVRELLDRRGLLPEQQESALDEILA